MFIPAVDIVFKWMVQLQRDSIVTVHDMTICMHSCNGLLSLNKASWLGKRLWGVGGGHDLCLFPLLVLKSAQANLSDVANTSDPMVDM